MSKFFQLTAMVVLSVLAINGVWQMAAAEVEPKMARQQWEWKSLNESNARKLDPAEGWELVTVDQGVLYFKRPK